MNNKKWVAVLFAIMVVLTLLTPFWVFKQLLFPFITSKAYYLRILVELTLPVYLYLILSFKNLRPSLKNPVTISVLAFLGFSIISGLVGVNPLRSFWGNYERMGGNFYLAHLVMLYFYVLLLGQLGQGYMQRFLQGLIWAAAAVTLDGIMVQLTHNHFLLSDPSYPRVSGTFGNPIFIASFLIIPMFVTAYYVLIEQRLWLKIVYGVVVLLELYVILLSQTRGAVVGVAAALFVAAAVYVALNKQKKIRFWGSVAIVVFAVLVGFAFTQHAKFPKGSMLYLVLNLKDSNTEARVIQWGVALHGYKDHPILGVGPEDYYAISNKYYNPAIFQYDASWFDKPHNYLIEVLVTTGVPGFLAYAAILLFVVWGLALAYKQDFLSLLEFCLLLAGFLAYQFQNLFVFDTISASLMFYAFAGFGAFLWHECRRGQKQNKKSPNGLPPLFANVATALSLLLIVYIIYVGNVFGIRIGKDINYGYAYSSVDPQIAKSYFDDARALPFNFDPIQFASKYADFASGLAADPGQQTSAFVNQTLQDAISSETDAVTRVPNDPTAWQELSNLYLTEALYNKTALDPRAVAAAQTAINLAPKRPEPQSMMARIELTEGNAAGAESIMQNVINTIPADNEARLQLALMYFYNSQTAKGLALAQDVLATGYLPQSVSDISWMAQAYDSANDFSQAAQIYQLILQISPGSLQDEWSLAQDDAKIGQTQEAISLAEQLIQQDPTDAPHFQQFIDSLK